MPDYLCYVLLTTTTTTRCAVTTTNLYNKNPRKNNRRLIVATINSGVCRRPLFLYLGQFSRFLSSFYLHHQDTYTLKL